MILHLAILSFLPGDIRTKSTTIFRHNFIKTTVTKCWVFTTNMLGYIGMSGQCKFHLSVIPMFTKPYELNILMAKYLFPPEHICRFGSIL